MPRPLILLALVVGLPLAAEDPAPEPAITVRPVAMRLHQEFRKPGPAKDDALSRAQQEQRAMRAFTVGQPGDQEPGLTIVLEAKVGDGWTLVQVDEATLVEGALDSGEALAAAAKPEQPEWRGHKAVRRHRQVLLNSGPGEDSATDQVAFRCKAPVQAATVVRSLRGTFHATIVPKDTIKRIDVPLTPGASGTPIAGCDLVLGQTANGGVTFDYEEDALTWIADVSYLDAAGQECERRSTSSQSGNSRTKLELGFDRPVTTVSIATYPALRVFEAEFALSDLPFVGAAPADVMSDRRVKKLHELAPVVPVVPAESPAAQPATP